MSTFLHFLKLKIVGSVVTPLPYSDLLTGLTRHASFCLASDVHRPTSLYIQFGASSRAKHGGAYFSAVRGSIKDPIAVPGRHEVTGV